jgi:hypothetical protein
MLISWKYKLFIGLHWRDNPRPLLYCPALAETEANVEKNEKTTRKKKKNH